MTYEEMKSSGSNMEIVLAKECSAKELFHVCLTSIPI